MRTGAPPYSGLSITEVVPRILRAPVPSARREQAGVPPAEDQAISRALAKTAAGRFASMEEFAAAQPPPPTPWLPRGVAGSA
jgi:hypothetical protein